MQQAPSICCVILSQLPYGLWFPGAGLLTKCPIALAHHHSLHVHTNLYSLIKSGSLQLNARQNFFQQILCLPGSSLGIPRCGLGGWEKSSLFVQSSDLQSPSWDCGSWALLQLCFGWRVTERMMQDPHQLLEMLSLTSAALALPLPDTT